MSSDNWEKRFDAVVKETEEKLARVKGTLSRSASPNVNKYDKYEKYSLKLDLDTRKASPEHYNRRNISFDRSINKSHDEVYEISNLKKQIRELEKNRSKQEDETRALKGQISAMKQNSNRSQSNMRDKLNEDNASQFDQLRKELKTELNSLKSSVRQQTNISGRGEGRCNGGCTGEIEGLKKDLVQNRSNFAEELQEMKSGMDILRSRMMRAELELSNTTAETKEIDRKHGRIEKEVQYITEAHRLQNKSTNNNIQSLSEAAAYVSLMRSNIGDLQQRFTSLENDLTLKMSSLQRAVDSAPSSERATPNAMQGNPLLGSRGSSYRSSDSKILKGSIVSADLSLDDLEDSICLDDLSDNAITVSQCSLLSVSPKPSSAGTLLQEEDDLITGLDDLTSFNNYLNDDDDDLISGMSGLLSDDD